MADKAVCLQHVSVFSQGFYTWYFYQIFSSSICFPRDGTTSDVDAGDLFRLVTSSLLQVMMLT